MQLFIFIRSPRGRIGIDRRSRVELKKLGHLEERESRSKTANENLIRQEFAGWQSTRSCDTLRAYRVTRRILRGLYGGTPHPRGDWPAPGLESGERGRPRETSTGGVSTRAAGGKTVHGQRAVWAHSAGNRSY